jgi:hypothetical protein
MRARLLSLLLLALGAASCRKAPEAAPPADGPFQQFRRDGSIERQFSQKGGKLHGDVQSFAEDGQLARVELYRDGRLLLAREAGVAVFRPKLIAEAKPRVHEDARTLPYGRVMSTRWSGKEAGLLAAAMEGAAAPDESLKTLLARRAAVFDTGELELRLEDLDGDGARELLAAHTSAGPADRYLTIFALRAKEGRVEASMLRPLLGGELRAVLPWGRGRAVLVRHRGEAPEGKAALLSVVSFAGDRFGATLSFDDGQGPAWDLDLGAAGAGETRFEPGAQGGAFLRRRGKDVRRYVCEGLDCAGIKADEKAWRLAERLL